MHCSNPFTVNLSIQYMQPVRHQISPLPMILFRKHDPLLLNAVITLLPEFVFSLFSLCVCVFVYVLEQTDRVQCSAVETDLFRLLEATLS